MRLKFSVVFKGTFLLIGTQWNKWNDLTGKLAAMRDTTVFALSSGAERRNPLPHPPLGGGVAEGRVTAPTSDSRQEAAEWVRLNLPICSEFATALKAVFTEARMTYASENGHTIGKVQTCAFSVSGDDLVPVRNAKP
jgi:hypothetical protein